MRSFATAVFLYLVSAVKFLLIPSIQKQPAFGVLLAVRFVYVFLISSFDIVTGCLDSVPVLQPRSIVSSL